MASIFDLNTKKGKDEGRWMTIMTPDGKPFFVGDCEEPAQLLIYGRGSKEAIKASTKGSDDLEKIQKNARLSDEEKEVMLVRSIAETTAGYIGDWRNVGDVEFTKENVLQFILGYFEVKDQVTDFMKDSKNFL
jgi:hypothetical protein